MIYFTLVNSQKQSRNIKMLQKLNNIKIIVLNEIGISNLPLDAVDYYIYINANIMPLKKVDIFNNNQIGNSFLKKRELIFYSLTSNEFDYFLKNINLNLLQENYFKKKEYIDTLNLFTDISCLIKFEKIHNFIVDDLYNYEVGKFNNLNRKLFHNNIENIIEKKYMSQSIEEEILEYNKSLKENKVNRTFVQKVKEFVKNNTCIKKIILFILNLRVSEENNYYLFNKKKSFYILYFNKTLLKDKGSFENNNESRAKIKDIKIDDISVEYKNQKLFRGINLIKINKKEFEKLTKVSGVLNIISDNNKNNEVLNFVKNQKFRGTNYNNIRAVYYTDKNVYSLRNDGKGRLLIQNKHREYFENPKYVKKIKIAKVCAYIFPRNKVLLYEKQINSFEESSSVLFKQICNKKNIYYLIKKDSPKYCELKQKYRGKILEPASFKYLFYFFRSKYIIGTEVPGHIFTIRSPYKILREELIKNDKHKYIFLQHGVMYSLSLETASRNFFKKGILYTPCKIVCSSYEEGLHLQKYGFYEKDDILNIGLPTFDNKRIKKKANKTVIMLTWRPWDEYLPFNKTSYYKALVKISNSISQEIKENLKIVFHPKIKEQMPKDDELNKYIYNGSVDELLYDTSILISDYSSIVFDAFNRGIRVIFWWEEKEECLLKYDNYLLLNEDNIFGDVVYKSKKLNDVILNNKNNPINDLYMKRFANIVEFNDDCNTKRLINKLEEMRVL